MSSGIAADIGSDTGSGEISGNGSGAGSTLASIIDVAGSDADGMATIGVVDAIMAADESIANSTASRWRAAASSATGEDSYLARVSGATLREGNKGMTISSRGIIAVANGGGDGDSRAMLWIPVRIRFGRPEKRWPLMWMKSTAASTERIFIRSSMLSVTAAAANNTQRRVALCKKL